MTVVGRKPKPTAIKLLEGNPGKRRLNENEPKPRPILPECPDWLMKEAKEKWREFMPMLERTGVMTELDGDALALYCQAFANWKKYEELAAKIMPVIKTPSGYVQQNPMVAACMKAAMLVNRLGVELGLTPSSRSRIGVESPEDHAVDFFGY